MWSGYFCGLKTILSVEKIPKQNFKTIFCSTKNEKNKSFWPKSLVNPFGKYAKMRLSEVAIFMGLRGFFSVERIPKQNFKIIFAPKQKLNKINFFDQNHRKICRNGTIWSTYFVIIRLFQDNFSLKRENEKSHGLIVLENMQIWSAYFLKARNRPYLSKSSELLFLGCFFQKQKLKKIPFFCDQNFATIGNAYFYRRETIFFRLKHRQVLFLRI